MMHAGNKGGSKGYGKMDRMKGFYPSGSASGVKKKVGPNSASDSLNPGTHTQGNLKSAKSTTRRI